MFSLLLLYNSCKRFIHCYFLWHHFYPPFIIRMNYLYIIRLYVAILLTFLWQLFLYHFLKFKISTPYCKDSLCVYCLNIVCVLLCVLCNLDLGMFWICRIQLNVMVLTPFLHSEGVTIKKWIKNYKYLIFLFTLNVYTLKSPSSYTMHCIGW